MRTILIAATVALAAASTAAAQTKGYTPYSTQNGDTATVQTGRAPTVPGVATQPGAETARLGPYRGRMMHRRHGHSVRACIARANARHLMGRTKTRFIHRCVIGRR